MFFKVFIIFTYIWFYLYGNLKTNFTSQLFAKDYFEEYDVIVVGADPEGIAAAISSARMKVKTLLIDVNNRLGGLWVNGWLNVLDLNLDENNQPLNLGIFNEIFTKIGKNNAFDVKHMRDVLLGLVMAEPWLTLIQNIYMARPIVNNEVKKLYKPGQTILSDELYMQIKSLYNTAELLRGFDVCRRMLDGDKGYSNIINVLNLEKKLFQEWLYSDNSETSNNVNYVLKGQNFENVISNNEITAIEVIDYSGYVKRYKSKIVIDATQDADIVISAGGLYRYWGQDVWFRPRNMAVTLVFKLNGLDNRDWESMRNQVKREGSKYEGQNPTAIWGFFDIVKQYKPKSQRINLRGLNLGLQFDNSILVNAIHIFGVDPLNPSSRIEAKNIAKLELEAIIDFLKHDIPALKKVTSVETAKELYIRSSRQVITHYTLTVDDILENKDFDDKIAYGSYPLDVQAIDQTYLGDIIGKPIRYAIPVRCIVPLGFRNLLVVGRSSGYDSLAQSSARTVPVGIALGQAAGVLAAFCAKNNIHCSEAVINASHVKNLQRLLAEQGVKLEYSKLLPPSITKHWAYEGLKFWRKRAEASGGYENDYKLDEFISYRALMNRFRSFVNELSQLNLLKVPKDQILGFYKNFEKYDEIKLEFGSLLVILDLFETLLDSKYDEYNLKLHRVTKFINNLMIKDEITKRLIQKFEKYELFKEPFKYNLEKNLVAASYVTRGALYLLLKRWYEYRKDLFRNDL